MTASSAARPYSTGRTGGRGQKAPAPAGCRVGRVTEGAYEREGTNARAKLGDVDQGQSAAFVNDGLPDGHDRTAPASRVPASRHRPVPGGRQRQGVLAAMPPGRPGGMLGVKDVRMHRNQTRR